MATVLMTGSTGFIGTWIRRLWVDVDTHPRLVTASRINADLLEHGTFVDLIRQVQPATVLHLAWSAGGTPDYRVSPENNRWTAVTLEAVERCLEVGTRFVALGTVLDDGPASDSYSRAKHQLREALEPAISARDIAWVRPYYVFDADAGRPTVMAMAHAARHAGTVPVLSHPSARHDFVHAADVARGIIAVVQSELTGRIDIGSGRQHTVAELMAGAGFGWTTADRPVDDVQDSRTADTSILRATGWTPAETDRYFGDG